MHEKTEVKTAEEKREPQGKGEPGCDAGCRERGVGTEGGCPTRAAVSNDRCQVELAHLGPRPAGKVGDSAGSGRGSQLGDGEGGCRVPRHSGLVSEPPVLIEAFL